MLLSILTLLLLMLTIRNLSVIMIAQTGHSIGMTLGGVFDVITCVASGLSAIWQWLRLPCSVRWLQPAVDLPEKYSNWSVNWSLSRDVHLFDSVRPQLRIKAALAVPQD